MSKWRSNFADFVQLPLGRQHTYYNVFFYTHSSASKEMVIDLECKITFITSVNRRTTQIKDSFLCGVCILYVVPVSPKVTTVIGEIKEWIKLNIFPSANVIIRHKNMRRSSEGIQFATIRAISGAARTFLFCYACSSFLSLFWSHPVITSSVHLLISSSTSLPSIILVLSFILLSSPLQEMGVLCEKDLR